MKAFHHAVEVSMPNFDFIFQAFVKYHSVISVTYHSYALEITTFYEDVVMIE